MPDHVPPIVSIVIATHARVDRLRNCIARTRENVSISHELIVVGGGSDGTVEFLESQTHLRFIREDRREGATRAYNKGFRAATGRYVMWLNDDSHPLPGSVEAAIQMIESPMAADVGMIAFYHNEDRPWNKLDTIARAGESWSIYNVRGVPYANFGLLRCDLLARLGFLDERYYFCGWDPDLALKVQREAGLKVLGCRQAFIHHEEHIDDRKRQDMTIADDDNARLFAKWSLPPKFGYPDPAPRYRQQLAACGLA